MKERRPDLYISEGVDALLRTLKDVLGEQEIRMAALYGSAAKGNFVCGSSDIDVLIVLSRKGAANLDKLAGPLRRTVNQYRIDAMILREEELQSTADVSPVEFLEIRDTMRLLLGEDLLSLLIIDRSRCRAQVEELLHRSVRDLRQMVLFSEGKRTTLDQMFLSWCGRQDTLLRAVIRLTDENRIPELPAEADPGLAAFAAGMFSVDGDLLRSVYEYREQSDERRISLDELVALLAVYGMIKHRIGLQEG